MRLAIDTALQGGYVVWGAPVYDQVRIGWNETKKAAYGVGKFIQSAMTVTFPTDGRIIYRSLDDPDNARGHTADRVIIDEVGDVTEAAWYEVLRPMLMDTGGDAWFLGTPRGKNWVYREALASTLRTDSTFWNAPSVGCEIIGEELIRREHPLENPEIPFDEVQMIYASTPVRIFKQEILAEFMDDAGSVFGVDNIRACIDIGRKQNEYPAVDSVPVGYTMGIDLARVNDYTVIDVLDQNGRQVFHDRIGSTSWDRQIETIVTVAELFQCKIFIDSTGVGSPISEQLYRSLLLRKKYKGGKLEEVVLTAPTKIRLIDSLALALERQEISLMDNQTQTRELEAFRYDTTPNNTIKMHSPKGLNDDCVIALALAVSGLHKYSIPVGMSINVDNLWASYRVGREIWN